MRRRILLFLFVWEPLIEGIWAWLRYLDNRRKNKPLTPPWDYIWAMMMYGVVNGHIPLSDIEREFREGTPYEYKGHHHLDPDLVGVDLLRDQDSSYTIVGKRLALRKNLR